MESDLEESLLPEIVIKLVWDLLCIFRGKITLLKKSFQLSIALFVLIGTNIKFGLKRGG